MTAMTPKQRERLVYRLTRAIVWHRSLPHERDNARIMANALVKDLIDADAEGHAIRRALAVVIEAAA